MYQRSILAVAIIFFCCLTAEAQMGASMLRAMTRGIYDPTVAPYEGSPYLTDAFVESVVLTNNGRQTGLVMRYNIYDDNVEVQQNNGTFLLDPDLRLNKIMIGTTPFVVGRFEYKGKDRKGFLELLDSGKVSLFAKMVVEHKEKEQPAPMKYNLAPERFIRDKDVFYYRIGTGNIIAIDKVKNLVEALPEKNAEAAAFVKAQKISKNKEDLVKLFTYYNSLF